MTEVLPAPGSCAIIKPPDPKSGLASPLNSLRSQTKHSPLSREEILSILQDLVLESPLVDYMVAHGVISSTSARDLLQVDCKNQQKIEKLLDLLDSEYDTPQQYSQNAKLILLTNALRNTGQHALASQLDRGRKIKPAPLAASKLIDAGYGSDIDATAGSSSPNLRRRGQLNLWVQVAAIRLSPASCQQLLPPPSPPQSAPLGSPPRPWRTNKRLLFKNSIGCEAQEEAGNAVKNLLETSNGAYFWIDLKGSSVTTAEYNESTTSTAVLPLIPKPKPKVIALSRFLACLCCRKKRRSKSPEETVRSNCGSIDYRPPSSIQSQPLNVTTKETSSDDSEKRAREQTLRLAKLAILDARSNDFYKALSNPLSDALVKFLEQTLGVLVFGARVESHCPDDCLPEGLLQPLSAAAAVSIVATTHEALGRLQDAVSLTLQDKAPYLPPSSILSSALEAIFQQETGFLEKIDVKDIRLSVALQADEVRLAANELEE